MNKYLILLFIFLINSSYNSLFSQTKDSAQFSFFAIGDLPYTFADTLRFLKLIDTINKTSNAFTIHVGDIKSGSSPCADEWYSKTKRYFSLFEKPLIYTPGDNEWTDCNRVACGTYDPEERLALIRKMFFKDEKSFGKESFLLSSQRHSKDFSKFVENNRWEYENIMFATLHVVGSNNNFNPDYKNRNKEFYERDAANISWLEETFEKAKQRNCKGIVIAIQADMFYNSVINSGFTKFLSSLAELSKSFKKPVLLINGDSHKFLIDKPIVSDPQTKRVLNNFTRVQVFGEYDLNAVKITVNPSNPSLFEISQFIIE